MPEKRVNIQDIARLAGVGAGTVSRVLNNDPHVSAESREKVMRAIEQLGYRPSFSARHMRTKRSHTIGFITDHIATTPFAGQIVKGAQDTAWAQNKVLLMINTGAKPDIEKAAVETMLERQVEAIIYAAMWHRVVELPPNIRDVPTVLLDCYCRDRSLPSVVPNEEGAGYDATLVLLQKGHRQIGFINLARSIATEASIGREQGYQRALAAYDVPFDEELIRYGNGQADSGYQYTLELMQLPNPLTAIFCGTDRVAMGCYMALKELGKQIPKDIAVIGFDNQRIIAKYLNPPLSTMALPHYEMGQWAVEHLLGPKAGSASEPPIQQQLPCPYIKRESV